MRRLCLLLLISLSINVFAQTGKISGKVIGTASGQPLSNATLILSPGSKSAIADQNGLFGFGSLQPGVYVITCSSVGFADKIVEEIIVKGGEVTSITISLEEKVSSTTPSIIITTTRVRAARESISSLLIAQKNMANVSDGIAAESIRQTPDRTTGDVLRRVSGASLQDDRFAVIRGLNDRYNAAYLNGAPLPSTESDRKAFAFDIFPSSVLDNLVIYKTASPDLPGEFAGGIISLTTKSIPAKGFTSISVGGGHNSLLTGEARYYSETKGKTDWLGIDDGVRALPKNLPGAAQLITGSTNDQRGEYARLFGNYKWGVGNRTATPNFNFQLSKGFTINRKGSEFLGALFSVAYNRNFSLVVGERSTYEYDFLTQTGVPVQNNKFKDSVYNDEVILSALANIAVKVNNRNSISWKNNFSINTDNRLIKRFGPPFYESSPDFYKREVIRWFTSNKIFSSQLSGEHELSFSRTRINWLAAYSNVQREIPNLSRTTEIGDSVNLYSDITTATATLFAGTGSMFWSATDENIRSFKADISQPFKFMRNSQNFIKLGGGYQRRERSFTSRLLGFAKYNSLNVRFDDALNFLPIDSIFRAENLGVRANGKGGFLITDGTEPTSDYGASSELTQGYVMADQRFFSTVRLIYGARIEKFNQQLNAQKDRNKFININTVVTDVLPSVNVVYALSPKVNVRLSYSKTLNRPEFRELAPFIFYDYNTQYSYEGFDTLVRAIVNNYDFRFEFFPGQAQLFSVSAFQKDFTNPIEIQASRSVANFAIYSNAFSAKVYGVEAEVRTLVSTIIGIKKESSFLSRFTLAANGAIIKSNVKLRSFGGFEPVPADRTLQGQSPYLINASFNYKDDKLGLSSTLSVNRIGDRIFIAGNDFYAHLYERARTVLDFNVTETLFKNKLELRFTARDLLAQKLNFYYDFDDSKSFTNADRYLSSTVSARVLNFTATYKF